MSLHSSLRKAGSSLGAMRNVLKRHERVRHYMAQGSWVDGQSVLALPKIKQLKMKARKVIKEKEGAEGTAAAGEKPAAAAAAPQASAKA